MVAVLSQVVVDCRDPDALARWWCEVLGWSVTEVEDGDVEIGPADGGATPLYFARVPEPKGVKNRLHLDVRPADGTTQAAELERLLALGATRADVGQGPEGEGEITWHVLADPEGNEFCLLSRTPSEVAAL